MNEISFIEEMDYHLLLLLGTVFIAYVIISAKYLKNLVDFEIFKIHKFIVKHNKKFISTFEDVNKFFYIDKNAETKIQYIRFEMDNSKIPNLIKLLKSSQRIDLEKDGLFFEFKHSILTESNDTSIVQVTKYIFTRGER